MTTYEPKHEFDCEGCGLHVLGFGLRNKYAVPRQMFCAVCEFLNEHEPPDRIMEVRRRCEPGGWESERKRRLMPEWLYDPE